MKQVWQATDGTIFEGETDCEKYESKQYYSQTLKEAINLYLTVEETEKFVERLDYYAREGLTSKLINFIKSIGEQDANN